MIAEKDDADEKLTTTVVISGCKLSLAKFFSFGMSVFDVVPAMLFSVSVSQFYSGVIVQATFFFLFQFHRSIIFRQYKFRQSCFHLECLGLLLRRQRYSLFQFHSFMLVLLCRQRCFLFQFHSFILARQYKVRQRCFQVK